MEGERERKGRETTSRLGTTQKEKATNGCKELLGKYTLLCSFLLA